MHWYQPGPMLWVGLCNSCPECRKTADAVQAGIQPPSPLSMIIFISSPWHRGNGSRNLEGAENSYCAGQGRLAHGTGKMPAWRRLSFTSGKSCFFIHLKKNLANPAPCRYIFPRTANARLAQW